MEALIVILGAAIIGLYVMYRYQKKQVKAAWYRNRELVQHLKDVQKIKEKLRNELEELKDTPDSELVDRANNLFSVSNDTATK